MNYRTTAETLKKEIHFYNSRTGEYGGAEHPESLFVERAEAIISRENSLWLAAARERHTEAARPA